MNKLGLNEGQMWALRTCLKVLDTVPSDERVAVMCALVEVHILALSSVVASVGEAENKK